MSAIQVKLTLQVLFLAKVTLTLSAYIVILWNLQVFKKFIKWKCVESIVNSDPFLISDTLLIKTRKNPIIQRLLWTRLLFGGWNNKTALKKHLKKDFL